MSDVQRQEEQIQAEGPFGLKISGTGPNTVLALLMVLCFVAVAALVWMHHTDERANVDELKNSVAEMVYVLSLPQDKREKLQLTMPDSLRRKVAARRGDE